MTEKDYELQKLRQAIDELIKENDLLHARIEELEAENDSLFNRWLSEVNERNEK